MKTRSGLLAALTLAVPLTLAVAACSSGGGSGAGPAGSAGTIVVGATLSLTGSLDALGAPVEAGYQQEIADVNAAGGIAVGGTKEKLRLAVLDNRSDPATAASQATQLVRHDHAVALLGFATQQIVFPVALTAEQLHVPFLTSQLPVGSFANGDKQGWTYAWDLFYDEQQQATATARALASLPGDKKIALFTDTEPEAVVERPLQLAAFKAHGLDVVGDCTFPAGTTDFTSCIADAKAAGAQLLAGQMTAADSAALSRQLESSCFRPRAAFLGAASESWPGTGVPGSSAPDAVAPDAVARDILSASGWSPAQASPGQLVKISSTLGKKYAASSQDYGTAALAYAVAEVLTGALARAGSTSPGTLNTAIGKTDAPTTAGKIRFSPSTHTAATPYYITGG